MFMVINSYWVCFDKYYYLLPVNVKFLNLEIGKCTNLLDIL